MPLLYSRSDASGLLSPRTEAPKRMCSRARSEYNATQALKAVARYSHLRCSELSAAVFPNAKYGLQMSQRLVRRLVAEGLLASRKNSLGSNSYVLTRGGAAYLEVRGYEARHGLDVSSVSGGTCRHSILCAQYCIAQEAAGYQAWHEYAIAQGLAPLTQHQLIESYGKLPDAILTKGAKVWLVEVESAVKAIEILSKACGMAPRCGRGRLHPDVALDLEGIVFVFDDSLAHAVRIARAARSRWIDRCDADRKAFAQRITLCRVDLGLPLIWRGCKTEPLSL
jgi:hypothetical protein